MPTYPYISGQQGLVSTIAQLRKGFPPKVDAGYMQRFKLAPSNESYVISILRFLRMVDDEGNRVPERTDFFFGNDDGFKEGLEAVVKDAYTQLVAEMGDDALDADRDDLTHWFRAADKTSELVGTRQATTFKALAALAGHGELAAARNGTSTKKAASRPSAPATKASAKKKVTPAEDEVKRSVDIDPSPASGSQNMGLTVRVEVNLPAGGDAETYDAIFASIKKHLMP